MNKNTTSNIKNQVNPNNFGIDLQFQVKNMSKTQSSLLNELVRFAGFCGEVRPSQQTLGNRIGTTRETANRNIRSLQSHGLLIKFTPKYNPQQKLSCIYHLNPLFFDLNTRKSLRNLLPACKWLPKNLLLSEEKSTEVFKKVSLLEYVTPYIYKKLLPTGNNNFLLYSSKKEDSYSNNNGYKGEGLGSNLAENFQKGRKMSQNEIYGSAIVTAICKRMGFTRDQSERLAVYPDAIVQKAYRRAMGKDLVNAFAYMFKICSEESCKTAPKQAMGSRQPLGLMAPAKTAPMAALNKTITACDRDYTAVQLAAEIKKIDAIGPNCPCCDIPMFGTSGEECGFKTRMLQYWADKDFIFTGEETEAMAISYINIFRKRFEMEPILLAKVKPESIIGHKMGSNNTNILIRDNLLSEFEFGDVN